MASTSSSEKKTFTLVTSDGQAFEVSEAIARLSVTVKNMMEDDCASDNIPLPNVHSATMPNVIAYCKRHADDVADADAKQSLKEFDEEYAKEVQKEQKMLFDLIQAANYLNIAGLLNLLCETVANMMKGKTPDQIRETFHIVNDYTPAEEEEVRKENLWAFE